MISQRRARTQETPLPRKHPAIARAVQSWILCSVSVLLLCLAIACGGPQKPDPRYIPDDFPEEATDKQLDLRLIKILRQAQAAMLRGEQKEAFGLYKTALELAQKRKDFSAQGSIYNDLGLMLNAAGAHDKALATLNKALDASKKGPETTVVTEAHYNIGVVHYDMGNDPEAIQAFTQTLDDAVRTDNTEMQGFALNARGNANRRSNALAPAMDDYQNALRIWNQLERTKFAAVASMNVGYCQVLRGKPEKAALAFQETINLMQNEKGPDRDALVPHMEEMIRLAKTDPKGARKKVLKVLGRAPAS